jgi:hypothetical protein
MTELAMSTSRILDAFGVRASRTPSNPRTALSIFLAVEGGPQHAALGCADPRDRSSRRKES